MQHSLAPLSPQEMIPSACLFRLATTCIDRMHGVLSGEDTAIMAMILPDFCGELMTMRVALKSPESSFSVSNAVLVDFSKDSPLRSSGKLTRREHTILSARLTSMCRELLTLRALSLSEVA